MLLPDLDLSKNSNKIITVSASISIGIIVFVQQMHYSVNVLIALLNTVNL